MKAPFPWFGGKSRVSNIVWERFGDVVNYVEPFAGSLAVLLSRPQGSVSTETVNDLDCFLANFWRSIAYDAQQVAFHADWPVNEADLHARHSWLMEQQPEFRELMKRDPHFYDTRIAGWWVWGISQWIGSGWCSKPEWTGRTNAGARPRGIQAMRPHLSGDSGASGQGIFAKRVQHKRPRATAGKAGNGVHAANPGESSVIGEDTGSYEGLYAYFDALRERLRHVRVCCGDWTRILGPSATTAHGICGVFLDPPYDMRVVNVGRPTGIYPHHGNDVSADVRLWALENGDNPLFRIAVCGYEGEHTFPETWECVAWRAHGGYGLTGGTTGRDNAGRERIWFSPHCKPPQLRLFGELS